MRREVHRAVPLGHLPHIAHQQMSARSGIYFSVVCNYVQLVDLLTLTVYCGIHNAVLDLHVSAEVALQVELACAVRALEGLAAGVEMHVSKEVVHSVERLTAHLKEEHICQFARLLHHSGVQLVWT